jgi:hypothetical protein
MNKVKRGTGKPKYKPGDRVFRGTSPGLGNRRQARGTVVEVMKKPNSLGSFYYYYLVDWGVGRGTSVNSQHRLALDNTSQVA